MTPEEVKKAVAEAAEEILAPLDERLSALESAVAKAEDTEPVPAEVVEAEAVARKKPLLMLFKRWWSRP